MQIYTAKNGDKYQVKSVTPAMVRKAISLEQSISVVAPRWDEMFDLVPVALEDRTAIIATVDGGRFERSELLLVVGQV